MAAFTVAALVNGDVCVYSNSAADLIVDTDNLSAVETADQIEAWWNKS